ncbi:MAG: ABC transporter substrate-binding protein [Clostridiales bacterium]|jgi:simple sugar transport system substrate-binding protein|nr:ABC transporter substrate-binding protein [Clostridiales bacterium]
MKKFICAALSALFALSLAACGGAPAASNNDEGSGVLTVGFAQVGAESGWRTANTDSFQKYFVSGNGFDLKFSDAQQNQDNQIKAVRDFITQEVDYIVIAPVTVTGWEPVLTEAKNAGIPVILSDRKPDVSEDLYVTYFGGNMEQEGKDAVTWLEGYLKENGKEGDSINIVHLQGTIGSDAQIGRTKALVDATNSTHPEWTIVYQQSGEFTQAKGQEIMESVLKDSSIPSIDVIYSENDDMTYGAVDALTAAGQNPADKIIISFDGNKKAIQMIIDGTIDCVAECNPLLGPQIGDMIKKLEAGQTVPKVTYSVEGVYDVKNAEAHLPDAFGS